MSQAFLDWFRELRAGFQTESAFQLTPWSADRLTATLPPMIASNNTDYVEFLVHFGHGRMLQPPEHFFSLIVVRDPSSIDWNNPSEWISSGLDSGTLRVNALLSSDLSEPGKQPFSAWLRRALKKEVAGLGQRKLLLLRNKPEPFSETELEMIRIRQGFELEHFEPADAKTLRIRVRNRSSGRLRFLSVEAERPGRGFQVQRLETGCIDPGTCGEFLKAPLLGGDAAQLIVKKLPDPSPEDRYRYFEFERSLPEED
jgi:hypothetical protein